eukprot:Em0013g609a
MAVAFGHIREFELGTESITAYLERVQLYFVANDVANEKKMAVLLSVIGSKTYVLLRSLLHPEAPKEKTFDQLAKTLKEHLEPKPQTIVERFHFHRRNQEQIRSEDVETATTAVTTDVTKRINNLDLAKALGVAQAMEAAQKNALQFKDLSVGRVKLDPKGSQVAEKTVQHDSQHILVKRFLNVVKSRLKSVPFALKEGIEEELDRLEKEGIVHRVMHSEWATPIAPILKPDKKVRICGDFKVTINPALDVDRYPLPKLEELLATVSGRKWFSKLDLTNAYLQLALDEESQKLCTLNTHRGLYQYRRMPFGIASAPALFQKTMDSVLQGIKHVVCYIDDILVTGSNEIEHLRNLEQVFNRLKEHGIRLRKDKCVFLSHSVDFLGHRIDAEGIHPLPRKVEAMVKAPAPRNITELKSFLGMVNYYAKFLPNVSTHLFPLYALLKKEHGWKWDKECQHAFVLIKKMLSSTQVLTPYDPKLPLRLAADASAYGLGAVLSHEWPDGSERPIAFAPRTLASAERHYAQLEKETLALIFGIKKFHQYLYGRKFTLVTDHKPLTTILGPKKGIPVVAASRLQRWAMLLAAYTVLTIYSIGLHMKMEMQMDFHVYHYRRTDLMWKV